MSLRLASLLGTVALGSAVALVVQAVPRSDHQAAGQTPADLIVTNGYLVTMNHQREIVERGAVVVRDARIIALGGMELADRYVADKVIDARGAIVMPGMINTHTHVSMTVFRGLGDDVPDRLRKLIFPLEKALVDRELVYWGGLHGMVEMVEGGVTTFADMYYFEDEVARAARAIGLRGVLGETIVDFPAPDAAEPYGGFAYARRFIEQYRHDPLVTPALAPHAPYSLDVERLRRVAREAEELDVPVLMHVAEMPDEVETLRKDRDQSPVEYLAEMGLLNRRLVAAHCIFVSSSDIDLLASHDVGVAHAMVANIKSAKGVSPALDMFRKGVRVGLATDGPMSGNTLDIIGQLGYVAKLHKLEKRDRNVMPAADVVEMATRGGARALHLEDRIGSLEVGKLADLVVIDRDSPRMVPFYDVYSALVYAALPSDVRTTIVHGRVVMEDRVVRTVEVSEVKARVRAIGERISAAVAQGIQ
ncbi:MAG: amidohydrolase [Vicinamibacteraceae bacterium]|nr:amidohydrolase [Vicinamibacteraceae bacterium]